MHRNVTFSTFVLLQLLCFQTFFIFASYSISNQRFKSFDSSLTTTTTTNHDLSVLKLQAIRVLKSNSTLNLQSNSSIESPAVETNVTSAQQILSDPEFDIVLVNQHDEFLDLPFQSPYLASFLNKTKGSESKLITTKYSRSNDNEYLASTQSTILNSIFTDLFQKNSKSSNDRNVTLLNDLINLPPYNFSLFKIEQFASNDSINRVQITQNVTFDPIKGVRFLNPTSKNPNQVLSFVCRLQTANQTEEITFIVIGLTQQEVHDFNVNNKKLTDDSSESIKNKSIEDETNLTTTGKIDDHVAFNADNNDYNQLNPTYSKFRLLFANKTVSHVQIGQDIQLQCFLITSESAHSKNGFVWRKTSVARSWDYSRYQDRARDQKFVVSGSLKIDRLRLIQAKLFVQNVRRTDAGFHYCGYDTDRKKEYAGIFLQVHELQEEAKSAENLDMDSSLSEKFCDTDLEENEESKDIGSLDTNNHDDDVSTELDHNISSSDTTKKDQKIKNGDKDASQTNSPGNTSKWQIRFECEHSVDNPLIVKSRETFHIRIKVDFRCPGIYIYTWYYRMRPIDDGHSLTSDRGGFSLAILHKVENADLKDAGDYTLVIQRDSSNSTETSTPSIPLKRFNRQILKAHVPMYSNGSIHKPKVVKLSEDATIPINGVLVGSLQALSSNKKNKNRGVPHMYSVLVQVRAPPELHTFKAEKFYLNNLYSLACHAYSGMQTKIYWQKCDANFPNDKSLVANTRDCSTCNWTTIRSNTATMDLKPSLSNKESLFDINWNNHQQVSILDFQYNHNTCYACVATNQLGTNIAIQEIIPSEIDLSIFLNDTEIYEGDNVKISCEGIFHHPPSFQWTYQSIQAPSSTNRPSNELNGFTSKPNLVQGNLFNSNNDDRLASSASSLGTSNTLPQIILAEKSTKNYRIESAQQRSLLDELRTKTLARYVEYVRFRYMYTVSSTLVIQKVQINQTGIYSCRNELQQNQFKQIKLQVLPLQAPSIVALNRQDLRSKIMLICSYSGSPAPTVQWTRNGQVIDLPSVEQQFESRLLLQLNATDEDFYGCVVKNRLGSDQRNLLVQIGVTTKAPERTYSSTKNYYHDDDPPSVDTKNIDNNNNPAMNDGNSKAVIEIQNATSNRFENKLFQFSTKYLIYGALISTVSVLILIAMFKFTNRVGRACLSRLSGRYLGGQRDKSLSTFGFAFYNNNTGSEFNHILPNLLNEDAMAMRSIEFPEERLELGRVLGQGAYGIVLKAEAIGIERTIKITTVAVKMPKEDQDQEQRKALLSEVKILLFLGRHLNVVNLLGIVHKPHKLMVIVEYCRYGNLKNFLLANRNQFQNLVDAKNGEMIGNRLEEAVPCEVSNSSKESGFCVRNPLSTIDLINFAFQISRGMQFIHSKKLLHRDLAARNVLLTDDYIVKICDFGLSKDVYLSDMYVKRGDGKLPIKWMAIESIVDQLFTFKSDVWSFAVLCWELFSLGANPYPGIPIDEEFHRRLQNGYRMERPTNCPNPVYDLIQDCWHNDPQKRPTFGQLTTNFYELMDKSSHNSYINIVGEYQEVT